MIPLLFIGKILLLGLSIAQVLSTVQVYVSNLEYYKFVSSVQAAGYLAVPNERVFSTLKDLGPALCGGLFFTFTVGAGLTILSSGLAWAWDRLFSRSRFILFLLLLLLLLCLVSANIHGFSPLITGYLLTVPMPVFLLTLKGLPEHRKNRRDTDFAFLLFGFLVFALILLVGKPSVMSKDRLLDIRDDLLLSNRVGRIVNAFYYENSLYSTRVFKSARQQMIKSCRLDGISDPSLRTRISEALLLQDYLPLVNTVRPDVRISLSDNRLEFYDVDKLVFKSSLEDFLRNPADPLRQVERSTARHTFLLDSTRFSLFFLGALLLYSCIYLPCYGLSGLFLKSTPQAVKAGVLWPLVVLAAFLAFRGFEPEGLKDPKDLSRMLTSEHLHSRLTALRSILRQKVDIGGFPAYQSMVESPYIPERYWLAKALGVSRTPETRRTLHQLLDDPHFNVVCMALDSLGRRGNRADIPLLLGKIETSDNWYEQYYAYRALRRLGWRQKEPDGTMQVGASGGSHVPLGDQFGQ
jgi:Ca2+/Na+ antiporter